MRNDTLRLLLNSFWLLKTFPKEAVRNLSLISASSWAKGGPSSRVIRPRTVSSSAYGPRRRAYPLSAVPPKRIC